MSVVRALVLGVLCFLPASLFGWETVRHDGNDYVTARSIKDFYRFDTLEVRGDQLVLENKVVKCSFPLKGTVAIFNGIKIHLAFPLVKKGERHLVSRITLAKTIDPILRPRHAKPEAGGNFSTIVIDPEPMPEGENDHTLRIARKAREELESHKFKVVLTRGEERLKTINALDSAIVISLRVTNDDKQAEGLRTWVLAPVDVAGLGNKLANKHFAAVPGNANDWLNIALAAAVHSTAILKTSRPDRGIARSRLPLLAQSKHPALILEVGNLANETEAALLKNPKYAKAVAMAVSKAVIKAKVATARPQPK